MASLPIFLTQNRDFQLMQTGWASQLNPLLNNPLSHSLILKEVPLTSGDNVINHRLGRNLQGWAIVDINGAAVIYRSSPKNNFTLTLNSDAAVVADILVY